MLRGRGNTPWDSTVEAEQTKHLPISTTSYVVKAVRGNTNSLYGGGKARNLAGSAVLWTLQYRMFLGKQTERRGSQKCSLMMQPTVCNG
jgi:hypothetical protein